jgi:hypothetical protein
MQERSAIGLQERTEVLSFFPTLGDDDDDDDDDIHFRPVGPPEGY